MFLAPSLLAMLPAADITPSMMALAPTADGKLLFVAMSSGKDAGFVCVWDLTKPKLKAVITGTPGNVRAIQPTADGKRFVLLVGMYWRRAGIEVWDVAAKKRLRAFEPAAKEGFELAVVSADGGWVASRSPAKVGGLFVWNTESGERAEKVEKAASAVRGSLGFSPDSKQLVVASASEFAAFEIPTGKKAKSWEHAVPSGSRPIDDGWLAALPNGKGVVTVTPTGKRRQSYVVRMLTEKKDWWLGQIWDFALPPLISPDGRWLIISGGSRSEGPSVLALRIKEDGTPEMEGNPEKPAWQKLPLGQAKAHGREWPRPPAFSADGKLLFAASPGGQLSVYSVERRVVKATLFAAGPKAGDLPDWHIVTPAGEFVASPAEAEVLAKAGKVKDASKVREAFGLK